MLAPDDLVAPQLVLVEPADVLRRLERERLPEPREADEARRDLLSVALDRRAPLPRPTA